MVVNNPPPPPPKKKKRKSLTRVTRVTIPNLNNRPIYRLAIPKTKRTTPNTTVPTPPQCDRPTPLPLHPGDQRLRLPCLAEASLDCHMQRGQPTPSPPPCWRRQAWAAALTGGGVSVCGCCRAVWMAGWGLYLHLRQLTLLSKGTYNKYICRNRDSYISLWYITLTAGINRHVGGRWRAWNSPW